MANPKKRKTSSKTRKGRSHAALKTINLIKCDKCGKMKKPHMTCDFCGFYQGREVIKVSDSKK